MSIKKKDIQYFIQKECNNFVGKITKDEIYDLVEWCNRLIKERQKIEDDIVSKIRVALSEAKEQIDNFYKGAFDTDFMLFSRSDLYDGYGVEIYTIEMAVEKIHFSFPYFTNLDTIERKKLMDTLVEFLDANGAFWD